MQSPPQRSFMAAPTTAPMQSVSAQPSSVLVVVVGLSVDS